MRKFLVMLAASVCLSSAWAADAVEREALANMPIREVTVFKDGHAFVLHSGKMPVDEKGNVVMTQLPRPVLGTFWPFATEGPAKLQAVVAGQRKVWVQRTPLNLPDMIEANISAKVVVTELPAGGKDPLRYSATILGRPAQSGQELEESNPDGGLRTSVKGNLVLLKTDQGTKALAIDLIADITFPGDPGSKLGQEEIHNVLTLKLAWANAPAKEAQVGMAYLQRGLRWIPHYKLTVGENGQATLQLQATLINELADLEDVTAQLVIGVPSFEFKDTLDPIALQKALAPLSPYFEQNAQTRYAMSNALMSQVTADNRARREDTPAPTDLGPEVAGSAKAEDLFVFTLRHITLKKGQRMVVPVNEMKLAYRDVYRLDIPFMPPMELWRNIDSSRHTEMLRLTHAPKVMHKLRLTNGKEYPLTTAPTLIIKDGRVLAQGMMTYTPAGGEADVTLTTAVDIQVKKSDIETGRVPNAANWQGDQYGRINLEGKITLTNFGKQAVEVEVVRQVLGNVTEAEADAKIEMVNVFEEAGLAGTAGGPVWWSWYNWPYWWHHFNGVGRITWTLKLEPGKPTSAAYRWHYFWR